ncbi:MAG: imelysin family protein [Pseudomonadota bacterium]
MRPLKDPALSVPTLFQIVFGALTLFGAFMLGSSTAQAALGEKDYEAVNARIIENQVVPRYEAFATASEALAEAADSFAEDTSEATLIALQQAFYKTMDAWMAVEHIRFGPSKFEDRADRIFFWPDRHNTGSRQISRLLKEQDPTALDAEVFADGTAAVQGLPAMERLLFGGPSQSLLLESNAEAQYLRNVLSAIGNNLDRLAKELVAAWSDQAESFKTAISSPDENNPYFKDHKGLTLELFRSLQEGLTRIDAYKLSRPLGDGCEKPRPRRSESWRSGRSKENLIINLTALRDLYGDDTALFSIRKYHFDPRLDQSLRMGFDDAISQLKSLSASLSEAVQNAESCGDVVSLQEQVKSLSSIVEGDLAQALELSAGFNFNDGD